MVTPGAHHNIYYRDFAGHAVQIFSNEGFGRVQSYGHHCRETGVGLGLLLIIVFIFGLVFFVFIPI